MSPHKKLDKYLIQNWPVIWLSRIHIISALCVFLLIIDYFIYLNESPISDSAYFFPAYCILLIPVLFIWIRFQFVNYQRGFTTRQLFSLFINNALGALLISAVTTSIFIAKECRTTNLKATRGVQADLDLLKMSLLDSSFLEYCFANKNRETMQDESLARLYNNYISEADSNLFTLSLNRVRNKYKSVTEAQTDIEEAKLIYKYKQGWTYSVYDVYNEMKKIDDLGSLRSPVEQAFVGVMLAFSVGFSLTVIFWISSKKVISYLSIFIGFGTYLFVFIISLALKDFGLSEDWGMTITVLFNVLVPFLFAMRHKKALSSTGIFWNQLLIYNILIVCASLFILIWDELITYLGDRMVINEFYRVFFSILVVYIPVLLLSYFPLRKYTEYLNLPRKSD